MSSQLGLSHQTSIDTNWLHAEAQRLFARNRVSQLRHLGGSSRHVTYHAPYLNAEGNLLPASSRWLGPGKRLWQRIKAPTIVRYPHQWFWDSCAHAIVLAHIDIDLARKEIESLLASQGGDGFIPHMIWNPDRMHWGDRWLRRIYRSPYGSTLLQPPLLADAVERIYRANGDLDFVNGMLPSLNKYYSYIDRVRVRSDDGLPEIIISYESGKDRSPEYDAVYGESSAKATWKGPMFKLMFRYWRNGWDTEKIFEGNHFRVKDLLFCSIYAQNMAVMSRLHAATGNQLESDAYREKARQTEQSILDKMFAGKSGLFYSLDARHGRDRIIPVSTVSSLMPLILDTISKEQVERLVNQHLRNPGEFWARYPVPVNPLLADEETIKGHVVWRGKETWFFTNWYIAGGLRKQGRRFPEHRNEYAEIAEELMRRSYKLVRKEGFREYYDARTGKGGGAFDFGWSTLLLDMVYDVKA